MALRWHRLCAAQTPDSRAGCQASSPQRPASPPGRPPVQAKTQEEYQAYQAAVANAQNPAAMEKSADDFAAKFPASDLRVLLYRAAMQSYQNAGDSPKMLNMGQKVLAIDKDDPDTLISGGRGSGRTDFDHRSRQRSADESGGQLLPARSRNH